jgi:hypothetical protein
MLISFLCLLKAREFRLRLVHTTTVEDNPFSKLKVVPRNKPPRVTEEEGISTSNYQPALSLSLKHDPWGRVTFYIHIISCTGTCTNLLGLNVLCVRLLN